MALNSSGPISLAGTTAGQSIELENGGNGTTQISLNDAAVRALAGVPSGAITMPTNFWGKSNRVSISYTFSANTTNASLNVTSIGGYSAGKSDITVTVNSGIYLWSNSTGTPGLTLSGGTSGDTITVVNNGYIMGMGGTGGARQNPNSGSFPSTAGGPAISIAYPVTINNTNASAYIGGGGGGGGCGNAMPAAGSDYAGGGGGAGGGNALDANDGNAPGGAIGSSGSPGTNVNVAGGGAGGRIFPGTGGSGGVSPQNIAMDCNGKGGGSGGGGGAKPVSVYQTGGVGGGGGGWGAAGGTAYGNNPSGTQTGGAGGSAGATGGNGSGGPAGYTAAGSAGGKAVALNGNTVTWTSGNTTRVYGSVS